ncbi:MAG: DUF1778 domain-containing protein [Proteobacteria bacterium]|nr:DUF1778 domain-containing protein [Pseudomonadota bacterium]
MKKDFKNTKTSQLQIRVSPEEKKLIAHAAKREGQDISTWVLKKLINNNQGVFFELVVKLASAKEPRYVLSELNDFINKLSAKECQIIFNTKPDVKLSTYLGNYLAAMIEQAATKKGFSVPSWLEEIEVLKKVHFETNLISIRPYLLINSPIAFRKRGIFLDSTIGDRV